MIKLIKPFDKPLHFDKPFHFTYEQKNIVLWLLKHISRNISSVMLGSLGRVTLQFTALMLLIISILVQSIDAAVTCADTDEALRDQWRRYTNILANDISITGYLPNASLQTAVLSLLTQKYEEDYWAILNAQGSSADALRYTRIALDNGDLKDACMFLQHAVRWIEFAGGMREQSIEDFDNGTTDTARLYLSLPEIGLAPFISGPAAIVLRGVSLYFSYSIYRLENEETAEFELGKEIFIDFVTSALFKLLSNKLIPYKELVRQGEAAREAWIRGSPELIKKIGRTELRDELFHVISTSGILILNDKVKQYVDLYLDYLYDDVDEHLASQEPILPTSLPIRTASSVHPDISEISLTVPNSSLEELQNITITTIAGNPIAVQQPEVAGETVTISLDGSLQPGTLYKINNVPSWNNLEIPWTFSTEHLELSVGAPVEVANTGGEGLNLRSTPAFFEDGRNIITAFREGTQLTTIGGPVLQDGFTWWQVTNGNQTGWSAVGYWLVPDNGQGLTVGTDVVVGNTSGGGLWLRSEPGLNGTQLIGLSDGTRMTVISGPVYMDGFLWWNITGEAGIGWSATAPWLLRYAQAQLTSPSITTNNPLPVGQVGEPYRFTFQATGGTPPYDWSVSSGALPNGLSLSNAGVVSGIPTEATRSEFIIRVVDSNDIDATKSFEIFVGETPPQTGSIQVIIQPQEVVNSGAQWRLTTQNIWRNSGDFIPNLPYDTHTITFRQITGWQRPLDEGITIFGGNPNVSITREYIKDQPIELPVPTNIQVSVSADATQVTVSWGYSGNNPVNFVIERTISGMINLFSIGGANRSWPDLNPEPYEQNCYRVKAVNVSDVEESPYSQQHCVDVTPPINGPLPAPTNMRVEQVGEGFINIAWDAASPRPEFHIIERKMDNGSYEIVRSQNGSHSTIWGDIGLVPGIYCYRVYGQNNTIEPVGSSENSNEACGTIEGNDPPGNVEGNLIVDELLLFIDFPEFAVSGTFKLGSASNGIDPTMEGMTLTIDTYTVSIPASSFRRHNAGPLGGFDFVGEINGVALDVVLIQHNRNDFEFIINGSGVNLGGATNPVDVFLQIGDDVGLARVAAVFVRG